jgi:hypothetical protein
MRLQLQAIKYWIADHLLNSELDDAYHTGLREGADYAHHKISMSLQEDIELTKTQKLGYDIAMNRFTLTREAVNERLGIQK